MTKEITFKLSKFQQQFLEMKDEPIVILTTGVGAGKSRVAALWIVKEATDCKCRIIAAAQNYRALTEVLFREVENVLLQLGINYHYTKGQKFTLSNGSEIFGATAQNPSAILGFTDISAAVIDEAAYCPEELYNYITDRMRGEHIKQGKVRLISSPSADIKYKWFKDLCAKYKDKVIHATTFDNPFTSPEYKQAQIEKYGKDTPLYRQQLLGEFLDDVYINQIISLIDFPKQPRADDTNYTFGIDAAGAGVDSNVIVISNGSRVVEIIEKQVADTFEMSNIIREKIEQYHPKRINVDNGGGYSAGFTDVITLAYPNIEINRINFAGKPKDVDNYANIRAELYIEAAKKIKEGFYVDNEDLKSVLQVHQYFINNSGKSAIVPKDDIKKIIGHSPDIADAFVLSLYEPGNKPFYSSPDESLNIAMKFVGI